ncbi:MAG: hypothetical protein U1F65_07485 [Verrucomicrobiota bacterium]
MAWFKKKPDPISDRARALSEEIAALEGKIKQLDTQLQTAPTPPRLRPAALPQGVNAQRHPEPSPVPATHDPIFEKVDQKKLDPAAEADSPPEHFNELGVRKYDLPALVRRIKNHFHGPTTTNPKLVNYLAAGGVQGLRPMRYEKRVARNRFIVLAGILFLLLLGIIVVVVKR